MAVNMIDVVRKNGDKIDLKKLCARAGLPGRGDLAPLKGEGSQGRLPRLAMKPLPRAQARPARAALTSSPARVEHAIAHIEESIQGTVD